MYASRNEHVRAITTRASDRSGSEFHHVDVAQILSTTQRASGRQRSVGPVDAVPMKVVNAGRELIGISARWAEHQRAMSAFLFGRGPASEAAQLSPNSMAPRQIENQYVAAGASSGVDGAAQQDQVLKRIDRRHLEDLRDLRLLPEPRVTARL